MKSCIHLTDHSTVAKIISKEGFRYYDRHNAAGLKQFIRLDTVIELREHFFVAIHPPFQIEGRVAKHVVKEDTRLIQSDIPVYDIGIGIEVLGNLVGFVIQLTAVEIILRRHKVEEAAYTAGKICDKIAFPYSNALGYRLTYAWRREELSVLDFLFSIAEFRIAIVVGALQTV